uniref:RNA polymerase sigma-70 region 2 domain-containing protein n=1 Tax=candidate division WOR-3 bacterium TaxID=2052148 RepID=A0A7C4U7G0_UNCW3
MEEKEIIKEVKNGKKELFGSIVEKYMKKAYAVALYYTHDTHLSWDISQEAFYRVFKNIRNFKENEEFFPYLYKVIVNIIERSIGWIFLSIGLIITISFGLIQLVQGLMKDTEIPLYFKVGIFSLVIGFVILIVSIFRERLILSKYDKYKEVER